MYKKRAMKNLQQIDILKFEFYKILIQKNKNKIGHFFKFVGACTQPFASLGKKLCLIYLCKGSAL